MVFVCPMVLIEFQHLRKLIVLLYFMLSFETPFIDFNEIYIMMLELYFEKIVVSQLSFLLCANVRRREKGDKRYNCFFLWHVICIPYFTIVVLVVLSFFFVYESTQIEIQILVKFWINPSRGKIKIWNILVQESSSRCSIIQDNHIDVN